jgi:hypothetical protein
MQREAILRNASVPSFAWEEADLNGKNGETRKPKVSENFQPRRLIEGSPPPPVPLTVAPKIQLERRLRVRCPAQQLLLVTRSSQNRCFEVGIS